jgi:hypothetical protein
MLWKIKQVGHPLWQYLNQPIFPTRPQSIWQFSRFWYFYKIQFLEKCLKKDISSESHYTQ